MPDPDTRTEPRPAPAPSARQVLLAPSMIAVHLFAVAFCVGCLLAGRWQIGVYETDQARERADLSQEQPVPLVDVLEDDGALLADDVGRPVTVRGTYGAADEQVLVADREHDDRDGWWVVSPLLVEQTDAAFLVVRGWTGSPELPAVPAGPVEVTAAMLPGDDADATRISEPGPDRVVELIRLQTLLNDLPYPLYPAYGIRTGSDVGDPDPLVAVAPPTPDASWTTGLTNLAYGLQWWAFAAFGLFLWWRIAGDRLRLERGTPPNLGT